MIMMIIVLMMVITFVWGKPLRFSVPSDIKHFALLPPNTVVDKLQVQQQKTADT